MTLMDWAVLLGALGVVLFVLFLIGLEHYASLKDAEERARRLDEERG